jgi:hypothetical protein
MLAAALATAGVLPPRPAPPADRRRPLLDLPNLFWFFGAIVAAVTSILVIDRVPESHRDLWELLVSSGFCGVYAAAAAILWRAGGRWVPACLMTAVAVAMVPAIGYGFTHLIGTFPDDPFYEPLSDFSGSLFGIGLGTVVAALVAFALTEFAFLFFLVAAATLITAQLLLPAPDAHPSGDAVALTGIVTGCGLVGIGLVLDVRRRRRDAFWFHVVGFFGVAAALVYYASAFAGDSERGWIPMLVAGALVLLASAPLRRTTFAAYGAAGVGSALIHYLESAGSWFTYVLLALALGIFVLGVVARRGESARAGV